MNKLDIIELLQSNDKAIARALVVLTERQTAVEQNAEQTINRNGVGYTPADAHMGTSMSQFYQRRGYLTEKQLAYWKKPNKNGVWRICKYAGQLLEIAQQKAAAAKMMEERIAEKTAFAQKEARQEQAAFDVGNMAEELMILEEELGLYMDSDDEEGIKQMANRIEFLKQAIARAYKEMA